MPENLGYAHEKITFTICYQGQNFQDEGVDNLKSYPHIGEWTFPLGENRETHTTRAHLKLKIRLGDDRTLPISEEYADIFKDINHIEGEIIEPQHPIGLHYDGRKAYLIERLTQRWIYPKRLVEIQKLSDNSYSWARIETSRNVPTHEGYHNIYTIPLPLRGAYHARDPEGYRGDYGLLVSDSLQEQYRNKELDSGLLVYSNGTDLFLPKVTQELWERSGGERVGFGIVSYQDVNPIALNPGTCIRGHLRWPEGLYLRILQNNTSQERKEVWRKLKPLGENLDETDFLYVENTEDKPTLNVAVTLKDSSENFPEVFRASHLINHLTLDAHDNLDAERETILLDCLGQWSDLENLNIILNITSDMMKRWRTLRYFPTLPISVWRAMPLFLKNIELAGFFYDGCGASFFIDHMHKFINLKRLIVKNILHTEELARIIESLTQLPQLFHIDFEASALGRINATSFVRNLEYFPHLAYLSFKDVVYKRMDEGYLKGEPLDDAFAAALAQGLRYVPALKHLNLGQTEKVRGIQTQGAIEIGSGLRLTPSLEFLDLSGNPIGGDGCRAVAKSFQFVPRLQYLGLMGCGLGENGLRALVENLPLLSSLRHLYIGDNNINNTSLRAFCESSQYLPNLETLSLEKSTIGDELSSPLSYMFSVLTSIQNLNMSQNQLRNDSIRAVAHNLRFMTKLKHLNLSSNSISNQGLQDISQNLQYVTQLTYLILSCNQSIGNGSFKNEWDLSSGPGVRILAENLRFIPCLEYLGLGQNNMGDESASELTQNLHYLSRLTFLDLSCNYLGSETIIKLTNVKLPYLNKLILNQSCMKMPPRPLSMETATAIANNIQNMPRLRFMSLSYIPRQGAELIRKKSICVSAEPYTD